MKKPFGVLPDGRQATLYTIKNNALTATPTDFGATLVSLWVPDKNGTLADVVLGYDEPAGYEGPAGTFFGATVGRSANRIAGASFELAGRTVNLTPNENTNNLHSGPDFYHARLRRFFLVLHALYRSQERQGAV